MCELRGALVQREHVHGQDAAAAGLHYAHEKRDSDGRPCRIVHCDVSPSNVMLSADGYVKILDFGLARLASEVILTGGDRGPGAIPRGAGVPTVASATTQRISNIIVAPTRAQA